MSKKPDVAEGCVCAVVGMALAPFSMLLHGWTASVLWGWFLAGHHGIPEVGIAPFVGVFALASLIRRHPMSDPERTLTEILMHSIVVGFLHPPLLFALAWLVGQVIGAI